MKITIFMNKCVITRLPFICLTALLLAATSARGEQSLVDTLVFGDAQSESSHAFQDGGSRLVPGGLGESARRLEPPGPGATNDWSGGSVSFDLKVDPNRQNYVTARFWGSDTNASRLILFCDGKQVGYRHLGDI
ncbi:MAG TPA: hypothetical protein VFV81_07240, partial [Verrucomicrobiae bacterium]|nr:hypothetical protein [Verrucomicrobiae bacterium]